MRFLKNLFVRIYFSEGVQLIGAVAKSQSLLIAFICLVFIFTYTASTVHYNLHSKTRLKVQLKSLLN